MMTMMNCCPSQEMLKLLRSGMSIEEMRLATKKQIFVSESCSFVTESLCTFLLIIRISQKTMNVFGARLQGKPLPLAYYVDAPVGAAAGASLPSDLRVEGATVFEAASNGNLPLVGLFLMGGMDPNVQEQDHKKATPMHYAAQAGDGAIIRFLYDNGARVETLSASGETPLMWAAQAGQLDAAMMLLDLGAKLDVRDDTGAPILFHSIKSSLTMHSLILRGADPMAVDPQGRTLFHWAAMQHDMRIMVLYLSENTKIDINAKDNLGRTALHYGLVHSDLDTIKVLVSHGAENSIVDTDGFTATSQRQCVSHLGAFVNAYFGETNAVKRSAMAKPDWSNWARLDRDQLIHFMVPAIAPNVLLFVAADLPLLFGIPLFGWMRLRFRANCKVCVKAERSLRHDSGLVLGGHDQWPPAVVYQCFPRLPSDSFKRHPDLRVPHTHRDDVLPVHALRAW